MSIQSDPTQVRVISADDVARLGRPELALGAARTAARVRQDPESDIKRLNFRMPGGWMRILGASLPALGVFGYKEFHFSPGGRLRYAIHLFAHDDGRPLGIVDAALITPLRTAAGAAAAACAFYSKGTSPLTVCVIGSGAEAQAGLRALCSALPVTDARVCSRSEGHRRAFAERMGEELDLAVQPVLSLADAVDGSDLVYLATNSGGRVVASHEELAGVDLVLSIGSTMPDQRELSGEVLAKADVIVIDTPDLLEESGDVLEARSLGLDSTRTWLLGDYVAAAPPSAGLTVYKSIGSPEQDIVLASALVTLMDAKNESGRIIDSLTAIKQNL